MDNCLGTNAVLNISGGATLDLRTTSQTVSNALIYGKILMTINKGAATNAIPLNCWWQGATVGGTLAVTNLGGPLTLGDRNAFTSRETLKAWALPLVGEDTGGDKGRSVELDPADGTLKVWSATTAPRWL